MKKQWSVEKFEPVANVPVNELNNLKDKIATLQQALDDLIFNGGVN